MRKLLWAAGNIISVQSMGYGPDGGKVDRRGMGQMKEGTAAAGWEERGEHKKRSHCKNSRIICFCNGFSVNQNLHLLAAEHCTVPVYETGTIP